jgi:hypothetical protein
MMEVAGPSLCVCKVSLFGRFVGLSNGVKLAYKISLVVIVFVYLVLFCFYLLEMFFPAAYRSNRSAFLSLSKLSAATVSVTAAVPLGLPAGFPVWTSNRGFDF